MTEKSQMHYPLANFSRILWLAMTLWCQTQGMAQVQISPTKLDFGTTSNQTIWVRDLVVKNNGTKTDFLLRHTFSHEYGILLSSKSILPDSTMVIRVQFKPREKTNYNETILLYFASQLDPIEIKVLANVQYLNPEDHLACPDFSRLAKDCCPDFMFLAEVVDAHTQQPIPKAKLQFQPIDGEALRLVANNEGKVTYNLPVHYYYIKASAEGYKSQLLETYINHRKDHLRLELEPIEKAVALPRDTVADIPIAPVQLDTNLLSASFLPNNVLFLMDVSASMAKEEKLELMKTSINELARVLRPEDQITLMIYSEEAVLLMPMTSGANKTEIAAAVANLKASGNTNGAIGFKAAYKLLIKNKIKEGNNQLYVVTDGAFATADQALIMKNVKRSKRKGIHTSIIGIRANIFAQQNLASVAQMGNGEMIAIDEKNDTLYIIEDLKAHSQIK
jgi:von Willebrand factor type A domain